MNQFNNQKYLSPLTGMQLYKLPHLPNVKFKNFILPNNHIGYTGSILKRTVKNSFGMLIHYGMFYGIDESGTTWILENNVGGVTCIPLSKFLQGKPIEITYIVDSADRCDAIMKRVMERIIIPYNAKDNNCETFVNYGVWGKPFSAQSNTTTTLVDVLLSGVELYASLDKNNYRVPTAFLALRKAINLPRKKSIQDLVDKIGTKVVDNILTDLIASLHSMKQVTVKIRQGKETFYFHSQRFAVVDTKRRIVYFRLKDFDNKQLKSMNGAATYPVPSMRGTGWALIELANANRPGVLSLANDAYHFCDQL